VDVQPPLAQILVVVANILIRSWMTELARVFM
jgi:hypothetical protein